jgi:hypothetical protein
MEIYLFQNKVMTEKKECGWWNGGECHFWNQECTRHPLKDCFDCGKPKSAPKCAYVSRSQPPNYFCWDCTEKRVECGCIDWQHQFPWECTKHQSKRGEMDEWTISEHWLDHFSFLE